MVLVVIIGVLATMVRLAVGDGGQAARMRETARLLQQLTLVAADEAVVTSRPVGLVVGAEDYGLREWKAGAWQERAEDALFRTRSLPGIGRIKPLPD